MKVNEKKHAPVPTSDPICIKISMKEIMDECERSMSMEKRTRVAGYSNSRNMTSIMNYNDNDVTHGVVNVKAYSRSYSVC